MRDLKARYLRTVQPDLAHRVLPDEALERQPNVRQSSLQIQALLEKLPAFEGR